MAFSGLLGSVYDPGSDLEGGEIFSGDNLMQYSLSMGVFRGQNTQKIKN